MVCPFEIHFGSQIRWGHSQWCEGSGLWNKADFSLCRLHRSDSMECPLQNLQQTLIVFQRCSWRVFLKNLGKQRWWYRMCKKNIRLRGCGCMCIPSCCSRKCVNIEHYMPACLHGFFSEWEFAANRCLCKWFKNSMFPAWKPFLYAWKILPFNDASPYFVHCVHCSKRIVLVKTWFNSVW